MKHDPPSQLMGPATLQTVLDRLAADPALSETRKRDLRSAVIAFAKLKGLSPTALVLNLAEIRTTLDARWQAAVEARLAALLDGPGREARVGQGAVVVLDATSGAVRAMAGGRDYRASQFNRATSARRQPGSAFKPVFFLATFVEHLNYAFLPQYVQSMVQELGVQASYTSLPFITYYLCFAAVLIPAGRAELRFGPHRLIWVGLILAACGLSILAGQLGFVSVVSARALSGIGQGILFIGVQSYILRTTSSEGRTRGASVVVIGFQAGMISGMAIGSLLVAQLGTRGVFELGTAVAAVTALYAWAIIPQIAVHGTRQEHDRLTAWRSTLATLRDVQFLRTIVSSGFQPKPCSPASSCLPCRCCSPTTVSARRTSDRSR